MCKIMAIFKNTAAVVVLYNPVKDILEYTETYRKYIDKLYIIDNSPQTNNDIITLLVAFHNVILLHKGENIGIANALNLALKQAGGDGYRWLLTFDQDTFYPQNNFVTFMEEALNINQKLVAQISPLHNKKLIDTNIQTSFLKKTFVMTSASMINIAIAQSIGGFDKNLFIDEVDHDFCFRLAQHGYYTLIHTKIAVEHTLGEPHPFHKKIRLYPPERHYYMIRNYLYIRKKYYKDQIIFFKKRDLYLLKFFIYQLFYGEKPYKSMMMISRGIIDYYKHRYGKGSLL